MPSKKILLYGVPMFAGGCAILWIYWDRFKKPPKSRDHHKKKIFIAADCWLEVFDLLPPVQLGLGIALISHRFDYYVEEHFKTRKWTLGKMEIRYKIGENGAKKMVIVNSDGKALPIPQIPLPNKVIEFGSIKIILIDQNVLIFLRRFQRFFAKCSTRLYISAENVRILEFVMLNIWPMLKDTIWHMALSHITFRQIRQFEPSILRNCPSLCAVTFDEGILPEFPPDDSANASDGQAVAKWLFTPRPDNLPKMQFIKITLVDQLLAAVEQIKAAFSIASSPVNFGISVALPPSSSLSSVVPFKLTNEFTGEQLTLSKDANINRLMLFRRSIAEDDYEKWVILMHEMVHGRKNKNIAFCIRDGGFDNGLLNAASAGSSGDQITDQQQQKMNRLIDDSVM